VAAPLVSPLIKNLIISVSMPKAKLTSHRRQRKIEIMHALRHIAVNALVWATSASVLMASTPFLACRCPQGASKSFIFLSATGKASCCGTGTRAHSEGTQSGCCKAKQNVKPTRECSEATDGAEDCRDHSEDGRAIVKSTCQKVLVQANLSSLARTESQASSADLAYLQLFAELVYHKGVPQGIAFAKFDCLDRSPPITDLITSLQRLII